MKHLLLLPIFLYSYSAYAGKCEIKVTRVACPGQEAESYKKCDGKPECPAKEIKAASAKDCAKKALKECENARLTVTKSKTITATWDGAAIEDGKNFCDADRADFNKCN